MWHRNMRDPPAWDRPLGTPFSGYSSREQNIDIKKNEVKKSLAAEASYDRRDREDSAGSDTCVTDEEEVADNLSSVGRLGTPGGPGNMTRGHKQLRPLAWHARRKRMSDQRSQRILSIGRESG